ncbi:DUF6886 family protein [Blastococcus sp. TML/M2B]|uniref:DUF6886 family protein n=1 Tax=Blastococcus sp. TML/M2B TaxID=2798727 RepID=UPI0035CCFA30
MLHFSEDPTIRRFVPHRARTSADPRPLVWAVEPLAAPEPVGDLLALHEQARIQLRALPELGAFWRDVVGSTLGFSGIRLGNARPAVAS